MINQTQPQIWTSTLLRFDPHAHAEQLQIRVAYRNLSAINGIWIPDIRTIFLSKTMNPIMERCCLTHELGHATLGHRTSTARNELQADRWAANQLIHATQVRALAKESPDPGCWATELRVTTHLMQVWLKTRPQQTYSDQCIY